MYSDRAYNTQKKKAERLERELKDMEQYATDLSNHNARLNEERRALQTRCENLWTEGDRIGREYILYRMSNPRPPENLTNASSPMSPPKERGH